MALRVCKFALSKSCAKLNASPVQESRALWMVSLLERRRERFVVSSPLNPHADRFGVHSATASAPS
jgi:hypothetical protein